MSSENQQPAEEIFHEALDHETPQRVAFLEAACGDDEGLRRRVNALLAANATAPSFLEGNPPVLGSTLSVAPAEPRPAAAGDDDEDSIGTFGPYRLLRELGRGGQGTVYLARDPRLGRKLALKVLSFPLGAHGDVIQRFQREAEAASRLDHPGIATVYDAGDVDGTPYIAMRYVEGESLAAHVSTARETSGDEAGTTIAVANPEPDAPQSAPPPADASSRPAQVRHVLELFEKIARALHVAHEEGLVHRDIKPGNLVVSRDGEPVLLDFGLVRDMEGDQPTLTHSGDLMGTPMYMSPEQIAAQRIRLDHRTDIYSLGVTLYECLTLKRPFEAATREALYQQILVTDPPSARRMNPAISKDLTVVLETAMEKDRDRRYQSALEFAEDLRRVRELEPIHARPAGPVLRLRRWAQRNPAVATLMVAVLLALTGGLVGSLLFIDEQSRQLRISNSLALVGASLETDSRNGYLSFGTALAAARLHESPRTISRLQAALASCHERARFLGHKGEIKTAAISADGEWVCTGSSDGTAQIHDLSGRHHPTLTPDPIRGAVRSVRFHPTEEWVLTAHRGSRAEAGHFGDSGMAQLWDYRGRPVLPPFLHPKGVILAVFTPDGQSVLTCGGDGWVRIWPTDGSDEPRVAWKAHGSPVSWVDFFPDGRIVTSAFGGIARVWQQSSEGWVQTADLKPPRGESTGSLCHVAVSPDGERITASEGGYPWKSGQPGRGARLYKAPFAGEMRPWKKLHHLSRISGAPFSPDGQWIVTGGADNRLKLWNRNGVLERALHVDGTGAFTRACFDPSGTMIAAGTVNGRVFVYDLDGNRLATFAHGHESLAIFHPDGQRVLTASHDHTARLWRIRNPELPHLTPKRGRRQSKILANKDSMNTVDLSPDGEYLLAGLSRGPRLWRRAGDRWSHVRDFPLSRSGAFFSEDGERMVARGHRKGTKGQVVVWNLDGTERVRFPTFQVDRVRAVPGSDELLVCGFRDRPSYGPAASRRDPDGAGTVVHVYEGAGRHLRDLRASPDGRWVLARSKDQQEVQVYELNGERPAFEIPHGGEPTLAIFATDSVHILTAAVDFTPRLWRIGEAQPVAEFSGHEARVRSAAFSADGDRLATGDIAGVVHVWEGEGASLPSVTLRHEGRVIALEFTEWDGKEVLMVASSDGMVRFYYTNPEEVMALAERLEYRDLDARERRPYEDLLQQAEER